MALIYAISGAVIWLIFRLVAGFIDRVRLKEFDRQIGALFGAAKGVLFCVVITFFAVTLSEKGRETVLHSRSGHYDCDPLLNRADAVMPKELHAVLDPTWTSWNRNSKRRPPGARARRPLRDKRTATEPLRRRL